MKIRLLFLVMSLFVYTHNHSDHKQWKLEGADQRISEIRKGSAERNIKLINTFARTTDPATSGKVTTNWGGNITDGVSILFGVGSITANKVLSRLSDEIKIILHHSSLPYKI